MEDPPPSPYSKGQSPIQTDSGKLLDQPESGKFDSGQSGDSGQYLSGDSGQYVNDQYPDSKSSSDSGSNYNSDDLLHKVSDPDGTYTSERDLGSESSKHGEGLNPTRQDSFDDLEDETKANDPLGEKSERYAEDEDDEYLEVEEDDEDADTFPDNFPDSTDVGSVLPDEEQDQEEPFSDEMETSDRRTSRFSKNSGTQSHSLFPSNTLLVILLVLIMIVCGVLIGCLTYFGWEKERLDPLPPPRGTPATTADVIAVIGKNNGKLLDPFLPSDEDLLKLFATVPQDDVTTNGKEKKAIEWMLYEDPGKTDPTLLPRSDRAWIQRYVLAYTYFATTTSNDGNTTLWLSCNPPFLASNENTIEETETNNDESEIDTYDENDCLFTYPTELPSGRVTYDTVPSKRWLSGTDECQWGGVACGNTVVEKITVAIGETNQFLRSPVTSIVLTGQNLQGSIVTELAQLPHLEILDLSHNGLEGNLVEEFRTLTKLKLQNNKMSGTIPSNFFGDGSSPLDEFNVGANHMKGTIPSAIGLASNLKLLSVFDNAFTGTIPVLGNMPLEAFHGQNNLFKGILPFDYGYGGRWPNTLKEWFVYNNTLTGSIPEGIGFVSDLEDLRINHNHFNGSIPESIGQLERLFRFEAHSNQLVGTIPESMGMLPELRDVRVQFNALRGEVPPAMCFMESMYALEADCYFEEAGATRVAKEEGDDSPDEVIPSFASLEEAIAAARANGIGVKQPQAVPTPEVQCYCCTKCCNAENGDCLRFATNTISAHTKPVAGAAKGDDEKFATVSMEKLHAFVPHSILV